jgi:hypothetical protein
VRAIELHAHGLIRPALTGLEDDGASVIALAEEFLDPPHAKPSNTDVGKSAASRCSLSRNPTVVVESDIGDVTLRIVTLARALQT